MFNKPPNIVQRLPETWKDMEEWPSYQVSDGGRIRSKDRYVNSRCTMRFVQGKILRQYLSKGGYPIVYLVKNKKVHPKDVHRLVAQAFIPNPENKPCVNHTNGCKWMNIVENLEWVTYSENRIHSITHGLNDDRGENHPNSKLTKDGVLKIRELRAKGMKIKDIHALFPEVHRDYITLIIHKKRWKHI